jgi:hypothetical protein
MLLREDKDAAERRRNVEVPLPSWTMNSIGLRISVKIKCITLMKI